jgi:hypothetical protein
MPFYTNSASPAAPGTTNDILTLTAASGRRAALHEISICGLGTSSAANELGVFRPGGLGVTPTNQTSQKVDPDSGACSATVATAWSTQPSIGSVAVLRLGANSNGGIYRWVAKPGTEVIVRGDSLTSHSQLSMRLTTGGAGPMAMHIMFEEF